AQKIVPGEIDQRPDRLRRIELFEINGALFGANLLVGALQYREIKVFLVADVVVQHALVGAGLRRDAVNPRAGETMRGKFRFRRLEDAPPHALGVALPSQDSFRLCLFPGQTLRLVIVRRQMYHAADGRVHGATRHDARGERSRNNVCTPQVPLRTLITRVPGLRPVRTSDTSTPAAESRARAASMSPTRQLRPQSLSRFASPAAAGRRTTSTIRSPQRKN